MQGTKNVEPKTDTHRLDDSSSASSTTLLKSGIKRRRLMSRLAVQNKRRSYLPSRSKTFGTSVSKAFVDALSKLEEMSSESRNRQFHKLFSFIPMEETVIVSYSCALMKEIMLQGRMFISQNWICFHSNIFTFETQVTIKMSSITSISKARTAFVIPNAIGIETENEKHVFGSLLSRQSTYMQLIRLWKNAMATDEMEEEEVSSTTTASPNHTEQPHSESEEAEIRTGGCSKWLEQRLPCEDDCSHHEVLNKDLPETDTSFQPTHVQSTTVTDGTPTFTRSICQHFCKILFAINVFKSLERLLKLVRAPTSAHFVFIVIACLLVCLTISAVILTFRIARLQPQLEHRPHSLQYAKMVSEWSSLWWSQQAAHSQLISKMWEAIADNVKVLAQVHHSLQVLQGFTEPSNQKGTNNDRLHDMP